MNDDTRAAGIASGTVVPAPPGAPHLCHACLRLGRCRLGMTCETLDDPGALSARLACPADQEGGLGVAHGGWTAAMLDEVCGHLPLLNGELSVTASLQVDFLKPVPIEQAILGRAWVTRREGRRIYISGELVLEASGAVLARASGVWVKVPDTHFDRHKQWLAEQLAQAPAS